MAKRLFLVLLFLCIPAFSYANTIAQCIKQLKEGHISQAIELGKLAVVLHSDNPVSYMCLAGAYAKDGKYNFAKVELQQALILAKSNKLKNDIDKMLISIDNFSSTTKQHTIDNNPENSTDNSTNSGL
ncbi:MAG: tetratricopeptide repeat protein [Desulfurella sp.]